MELPEAFALNGISNLMKATTERVGVQAGFGDERTDGSDLIFTGKVYLYSERPVKSEYSERLLHLSLPMNGGPM